MWDLSSLNMCSDSSFPTAPFTWRPQRASKSINEPRTVWVRVVQSSLRKQGEGGSHHKTNSKLIAWFLEIMSASQEPLLASLAGVPWRLIWPENPVRHSCLILFSSTSQTVAEARRYCASHITPLPCTTAIMHYESLTPYAFVPIERSQSVLKRLLRDYTLLAGLGAVLAAGKNQIQFRPL